MNIFMNMTHNEIIVIAILLAICVFRFIPVVKYKKGNPVNITKNFEDVLTDALIVLLFVAWGISKTMVCSVQREYIERLKTQVETLEIQINRKPAVESPAQNLHYCFSNKVCLDSIIVGNNHIYYITSVDDDEDYNEFFVGFVNGVYGHKVDVHRKKICNNNANNLISD